MKYVLICTRTEEYCVQIHYQQVVATIIIVGINVENVEYYNHLAKVVDNSIHVICKSSE